MFERVSEKQSSGDTSFVKRSMVLLVTIATCLFGLAIFVPGPIQRDSYMGAEYCGTCHQTEYKSWAQSAHKRATDVLPLEMRSKPACLNCHATVASEENEQALPGVQCESCHGPGKYYEKSHMKKDEVLSKLLFMQRPTEDSCRHCHSDTTNLWSAHMAMDKIRHWQNVPLGDAAKK